MAHEHNQGVYASVVPTGNDLRPETDHSDANM